MNEDVNYYTVRFLDWDGTVLKTQQVEEGKAATAPADPVREGYTFIGWDKDFSSITENTEVTALYEENTPAGLIGDVNLDGVVDATDGLLIMRHSMAILTLTGQALANGDVNGDGFVNATDALLVMRIVVGA